MADLHGFEKYLIGCAWSAALTVAQTDDTEVQGVIATKIKVTHRQVVTGLCQYRFQREISDNYLEFSERRLKPEPDFTLLQPDHYYEHLLE